MFKHARSVFSKDEKTNWTSLLFSILLLMNNVLEHFKAFERHNVRIVFFLANFTSWKQPYNMDIIAAPEKKFKYLYLKYVLDFYEMDEKKNFN